MDYLLKEYESFGKMLFETDILTENLIEVDCCGKEISK